LGDISLESERIDEAIDDYIICAKIRKEVLEPDDRKIAEIFYNLGCTEQMRNRDASLNYFLEAKACLELHLKQRKLNSEEIMSLHSILKDLLGKIEEEESQLSKPEETKKEKETPIVATNVPPPQNVTVLQPKRKTQEKVDSESNKKQKSEK